jgi:hypothetical protein
MGKGLSLRDTFLNPRDQLLVGIVAQCLLCRVLDTTSHPITFRKCTGIVACQSRTLIDDQQILRARIFESLDLLNRACKKCVPVCWRRLLYAIHWNRVAVIHPVSCASGVMLVGGTAQTQEVQADYAPLLLGQS